MDTKTRMVFLSVGLAVTLASAWGAASASAIYENHFDVYRAISPANSAEAVLERGAKAHPAHLAKHRPAPPPVALSQAPSGKLPGTR